MTTTTRRTTIEQAVRISAWLQDIAESEPDLLCATRTEIEIAVYDALGIDAAYATIAKIGKSCGITLSPKRKSKPNPLVLAMALAQRVRTLTEIASQTGNSVTLTLEIADDLHSDACELIGLLESRS